MDAQRWDRVKDLVNRAYELDRGEREAFLRQTCGPDEALVREVESLIDAARAAPDVFERPAFDVGEPTGQENSTGDCLLGRQIDTYKLIRYISSGGMGTVYEARRADGQFEHKVAIKLIHQLGRTPDVLRRFAIERQTLASLNHPNIAHLLDGGVTSDGIPYIVMELIEGLPIDAYCDARRLDVRERLKLFRQVGSAVEHAHRNLIVHRDLKPANILVTECGVPRLLDFGIAKVLDAQGGSAGAELTTTLDRRLTPAYASPEQIRGGAITTQSDVYSLGIILYEILSGHRPYRVHSSLLYEIEQAVCEQEPCKPSTAVRETEQILGHDGRARCTITPASVSRTRSTRPEILRRHLAGDLDMIVMMAIRKDPAQRYASVEQFSADIDRYLAGRPVMAHPPTLPYRWSKFVRRHARAAAAAAFLALSLVGGLVGTMWQAGVAAGERDRAHQAQFKAEQVNSFLQDMLASADPNRDGRQVTVREVLDKAAARIERDPPKDAELEAAIRSTLGNTYQGLGLFDVATRHLERGIELRIGVGGANDLEAAIMRESLAIAYFRMRRFDEAEALLRLSLPAVQAVKGHACLEAATILNDLAVVLRNKGQPEQAEPLARESLSMIRSLRGDDDPEVAQALNNLSFYAQARGDLPEAERLLREALDIRRRRLPEAHPHIAQSLGNLSVVLAAESKLEEADQLSREAVALYRRVVGPDHLDLAIELKNRGLLQIKLAAPAEASETLSEALGIIEKMLPGDRMRLCTFKAALAQSLCAERRFDEAEPLLLDSYRLAQDLPNLQRPSIQELRAQLVKLYEDWSKPEQARAWVVSSASGAPATTSSRSP